MARKKERKYKPLTFTTTVRNPERMKALLKVISNYEGMILTNDLSVRILKDVVKNKLYQVESAWKNPNTSHLKSRYFSDETFNDEELNLIIEENPQDHKEANFKYGYPSRFHTIFGIFRQFGFFYYKRPGLNDEFAEEIKISPLGKLLISCDENQNESGQSIDTSELEANIFAHSMAKFSGNNPFIRRLNENIPLILLLKVINHLNSDPELEGKGTGIERREIALILVWRDDDSNSIYKKIKDIRLNNPFPTSDEVILEACDEYEPRYNNWQDKTLLKDIPDEFIRKMRITGLFSLRGAGRYLDINERKIEKIKYILENYDEVKKFSEPVDYFNYCADIDQNIIELEEEPILIGDDYKLDQWINYFSEEEIIKELNNLSSNNPRSNNDILKVMSNPVRLEFLCALAIKHYLRDMEIIPRYKVDDEGIPYTHAPSNGHDIECNFEGNTALVEVTLIKSGQQVHSEGPQTLRHLTNYKNANPEKNVVCAFIAPEIHVDFINWRDFQNRDEKNYFTFSIKNLIEDLSDSGEMESFLRS